jgi:hypothetical protein
LEQRRQQTTVANWCLLHNVIRRVALGTKCQRSVSTCLLWPRKQILCGLNIKSGASVANAACLDWYRHWAEKHP